MRPGILITVELCFGQAGLGIEAEVFGRFGQSHQEYRLGAGIDLASFSTVIIHCEQYTKLWAAGSLR